MHAAVDSDEPDVVSSVLAAALDGPVICDQSSHRYYVLVPPRTTATWAVPNTECLGAPTWLGVPRMGENGPGCRRVTYWSVPMVTAGQLCGPLRLSQLIRVGQFRVARQMADQL
ncbi:hypothetical protein AB0436_21550 [Streptomyces sp. NPDC051322]|uniref:hypothetical protein n=1 Tax=Streptomyces sp. NPDC051322 TaxID=3154645 RepID=UPI00344C43F5